MKPEVGKTYRIDNALLRCVKASPPTIPQQPCVFQLIDSEGRDIVRYDVSEPGLLLDSGRRIVFNRLGELELFTPETLEK